MTLLRPGLVPLTALLALPTAAQAREVRPIQPIERATVFAPAAGYSPRGAWAVALSVGTPWSELRAQIGAGRGVTPFVEVGTANLRRWQPSLGVAFTPWTDGRGSLSFEVLAGWLVQGGDIPQRGPLVGGRVKLAGHRGRVGGYVALETRHAILGDRTTVVMSDGEEVSWSWRHAWSPAIDFGLNVAIVHNFGLELGVDWVFVGAPGGFSIPGIHLGLVFGAGGPGA